MKTDFGNTFTYDGEKFVVGSDEWKDWVMGSDPFEGDFGCDSTLSDKIVKARNAKVLCSGCLSVCEPKTYNRVITSKDGGVLLQNRFCQLCCTAMGFYEIHEVNAESEIR